MAPSGRRTCAFQERLERTLDEKLAPIHRRLDSLELALCEFLAVQDQEDDVPRQEQFLQLLDMKLAGIKKRAELERVCLGRDIIISKISQAMWLLCLGVARGAQKVVEFVCFILAMLFICSICVTFSVFASWSAFAAAEWGIGSDTRPHTLVHALAGVLQGLALNASAI
jgi:hypothetical protein